MSVLPKSAYEYQVGGSLPIDAPSYVVRQADSDLYNGLKGGEFCYVLNSRQMGKSSLRVRTMQRLQAEGIACASIDITAIGAWGITPEQWYAGVIDCIVSSLELYDRFDLVAWWSEHELLPNVQRLSKFIGEVLLHLVGQTIVIFVDEIDSVLSLDFNIDDFFAVIRDCYNKRADRPDYRRLTFALIGVATPSDLIQDRRRTPFNIGRAIEMAGFQLEEAQPLEVGLAQKASNPTAVLQAVLDWTGGQPFLTQKVCKLILNAESEIPEGCEQEWVEKLVQTCIISHWESLDEPEHLKTIRDRILRREQRAGRLLGLYQQILTPPTPLIKGGAGGEGVPIDDSPEQMELRLTGLVVRGEGRLDVYNRIYESVFDLNWVEKELANLRPYSETFNAWLASDCQDESRLLRGQALQDALAWAVGKSLGDKDYQFLAASQELDKRDVQLALAAEREAKQIVTAAQQKAELALEEERQANQRLAEAQRKTKRQMAMGATVLALSVVGAIVAVMVAGKAHRDRVLAESQRNQANLALVSVKSERDQAQQETQVATQQKNAAQKAADIAKQEQQQAEAARQDAAQKAQQANQNLTAAQLQQQKAEAAREQAAQDAQQAREHLNGARHNLEAVRREAQEKNQQLEKANQEVQAATQRVKSAQVEAEKAKQVQQQAEKQSVEAQQRLNQAQAQLNEAEVARNEAQKGTELERAGTNALKQFESGQEIEALLSAVQSGQALKKLVKDRTRVENYPATSPLLAIHKIVFNIHEQNQLRGHRGKVLDVQFSLDGQRVATAGEDGTTRLWNLSGQQLAEFKGHQGIISSVSFSPNGQRLATAGEDGTARLWNLSGQQLAEFKGHQGRVLSVSFSPDGQRIATAGSDGTVRLWKLSGQQLAEFKGHQGEVLSVSFSPGGQRIATAGYDGTARLWNLSGQQLAEFKGHQGTVFSVSFSPDGQRIATAGRDGTVRLWSLSGQQLAEFKGHQLSVFSISFSPDGQRIASAGYDGTTRLWNLFGQQLAEFKRYQGSVFSVSFSPDGKQIVTGGSGGKVQLFPVESLDQLLARGCNWLKDYLATHPEELKKLPVCQGK